MGNFSQTKRLLLPIFVSLVVCVNAAEINEIGFGYSGIGLAVVELYGDAGESLDNKSLLIIGRTQNSDGHINEGVIYKDFPLSGRYFSPASRYLTIELDPQLSVGSPTFMLVEEFVGSSGDDIDTNDDGAIDAVKWGAIDHAIGYRSGTAAYGTDNFHVYAPDFMDFYSYGDLYRPSDTGTTFQRDCEGSSSFGGENPPPNPSPTDLISSTDPIIISEDISNGTPISTMSIIDDDYPRFPDFHVLGDGRNHFRVSPFNYGDRLEYRNTTGIPIDAATSPTLEIEILGLDCYWNPIIKTFTIYVEAASSELTLPIDEGEIPLLTYPAAGFTTSFTENHNNDDFTLTGQRFDGEFAGPIAKDRSALSSDGGTIAPNVVATGCYWRLEPTGLENTVSYDLSLNLTGIGGITDPEKLLVMQRASSTEAWMPLDTTYAENQLIVENLASFGEFTIGSDSSINPLPVATSELSLE